MRITIKLTDTIKQHIFENVKDQIAKAKGTEAYVYMYYAVYDGQPDTPSLPNEDECYSLKEYDNAILELGKKLKINPSDAKHLYFKEGQDTLTIRGGPSGWNIICDSIWWKCIPIHWGEFEEILEDTDY